MASSVFRQGTPHDVKSGLAAGRIRERVVCDDQVGSWSQHRVENVLEPGIRLQMLERLQLVTVGRTTNLVPMGIRIVRFLIALPAIEDIGVGSLRLGSESFQMGLSFSDEDSIADDDDFLVGRTEQNGHRAGRRIMRCPLDFGGLCLLEFDPVSSGNATRRRVIGDNHGSAQFRDLEEALRELIRQVDATVGGRIARQTSRMQCDATPSQSFRERHRGIVVSAGMVIRILFENMKHPGRSFVTRLAGADDTGSDLHPVAINCRGLGFQVYRNHDRSRGGKRGIPGEGCRVVDSLFGESQGSEGDKRQQQVG